jgi:FkbM family methyltransferase
MRVETLRSVTRMLPLPGRILRRVIDRCEPLSYPTGPSVVTTLGGRFEVRDHREYIQRNIYFLGYYEIRETRIAQRWLRPGDVFVDVGANIGWFTVLSGVLVGPTGQVFAFEPSPPIFAHLKHHVELNGLTHVRLENCALGATPGVAVLRGIRELNQGTGSIVRGGNEDGSRGCEVLVTTLDSYCAANGIERIRMLKIDVEGAEGLVLDGAAELLGRRRCDCLMIEIVDSNLRAGGRSSAEVCGRLREFGYDLFAIRITGMKAIRSDESVLHENVLAVAQGARL